jgi:hypothetical protein
LDLLVQVATPKTIYAEYRLWVVNGEVITASGYKRGSHVYTGGWGVVDPLVIDFAYSAMDSDGTGWVPNRAFCLDVFHGSVGAWQGYGIGEVNCIHAAGFYGADLPKLVFALEDLAGGPTGGSNP